MQTLQLEDDTPRILLLVLLALAVIMSPFGLINSSYNLATMTNIYLPLSIYLLLNSVASGIG